MYDNPERDSGPTVWAVTDAVFAGRAVSWETAGGATPPAEQRVLQELRRIADVIAAHEEQQTALDPASNEETWGPLVILEKIGAGAFGDVYRAREPSLDREVALKFFRPHRLSASQLTSEVIEEGRLLARVRHPNVVTVHGAKHLDGRFGIWMELIDGDTLEEIVTEQGPLSATEAMEIGRDLCRALAALHEAGVLHRDIKARNVMRERSGRVVLMDLGISCEIDGDVPIRQYGTPLFAAPEVLLAGRSSPQGDLYSLGVLLYFLVSGRYPVAGPTLSAIHLAHDEENAVPLASVRPDLTGDFLAIVDLALAADPEARFATAREFEQALDRALEAQRQPSRGGAAEGADSPGAGYTDDRQAYNHFMQGRLFWDQRHRGGLPRAMECYQKAIAIDPGFARAYLGIADCLGLLSFFQYIRPREGFDRAEAAARRALELDPDLGEVQATLGWILFNRDWDFEAAERHFLEANRRCPNYYTARQWYVSLLSGRGRDEEAMQQCAACRRGDTTPFIIGGEGTALLGADRFEEAIAFYRLALEADPDSLLTNVFLAVALLYTDQFEEAEARTRHSIELSGGEETFAVSVLANVLIRSGRPDNAMEPIEHLESLARRRHVSQYHRMAPWLDLGRHDRWGPLLEEGLAEHDPALLWIRRGKIYEGWLSDPRFEGPLQRAGLLD